MNIVINTSFQCGLLALGLFMLIGINFHHLSYATICFDCPGVTFHLDEAKKAIDNGDYAAAKNHIDQAKILLGQSTSSNQTGLTR